MGIPNRCSRATIESKALNRLLKVVELLRKVESANQDFVPSAAFVRECSQTLRSDPLEEIDV
jgi:hypothetical protein